MLNQQVLVISAAEYQDKTGKDWDASEAARLLVKSANHRGLIVDSISIGDNLITVLTHRAGIAE